MRPGILLFFAAVPGVLQRVGGRTAYCRSKNFKHRKKITRVYIRRLTCSRCQHTAGRFVTTASSHFWFSWLAGWICLDLLEVRRVQTSAGVQWLTRAYSQWAEPDLKDQLSSGTPNRMLPFQLITQRGGMSCPTQSGGPSHSPADVNVINN